MGSAFIVDAVRTPVGKRNGALAGVHPVQLGALPVAELVKRTGLAPAAIEDVVYGTVTAVGEQGGNVARLVGLQAGLPVTTTGMQLNRMCGSSESAIHVAAMGVASGFRDLVIAGGVESMSRVPMGSDMLVEGALPELPEAIRWKYTFISQGESAELVARKYGLTRAELDAFALRSHRRAASAASAGWLAPEMAAVDLDIAYLDHDEGVRRDTTLAKLAGLRPAFAEDGMITAGTSSQISDGAAALLLASEEAVKRHGLKPRARVVAVATAGVDPTIMLTGPVPASLAALERAGLSVGDLDAVEINEAFASVALGCGRALGLDPEKTNQVGGALANGHPLGASGAKLMTTLINTLERTGGRYGLQTMCIGFGQATATVIERL
jgi:acetyl-CoA acetyltransferase family protein